MYYWKSRNREKRNSVRIYQKLWWYCSKRTDQKTDILILGDCSKIHNLREDNLTGKHRKALKYIREGQSIEILSEEAFLQQIMP